MTSSDSSERGGGGSNATWRRQSFRRVGPDERPSTEVVLALAAATGREPTELTPPLHAFVDPEALDAILDSGRGSPRIEFDAYGCRVGVEADAVEVRPANGGVPGSFDG